MFPFWDRYPTIKQRLTAVSEILEQQLVIRNQELQMTLQDFARSGGKMLRPALFLMFSELGTPASKNDDRLIKIAASVELLHMATLIHDDIIDDSPLRRGQVTLQSKYGKDMAVYAGDLLFTQFFNVIAETMNGSHYLQMNAKAMRSLLLGELDQMHTRYDQKQSFRTYLRSINGKTAQLFWLACTEGAYFGGAGSRDVARAGRIGRNIGIAFQIYDDILDYASDSGSINKPVMEDVGQGVYTLPLLLAIEAAPEAFTPYLDKREMIEADEILQIQRLVQTHHGVENARKIATAFTEKARREIASLPAGEARDRIEGLTEVLLERTY